MRLRRTFIVLITALALVQVANAQDHWVTTWVAAPQQPRAGGPPPAAQPAAAPGGQRGQAGPGGPAVAPPSTSFNDQTIRMIVHTSLGGRRARVTLSNAYGNAPLKIGTAHIALRSKEAAIVPASDRMLMFNGKSAVTIPQGAQMISDPVDLEIPQLGDVAVSVYIPGESGQLTTHATGLHTTYIAKGNVAADPALNEDATTTRSYYWISAIDVMAPVDAGAIVAFGDSITDGATSTNDADRSWPSALAARIFTTPGAPKMAVLNQGISGNQLLADGAGVNALARFDRDVLGMSGVKWVMILEGINDIGITTSARGNAPPNPVTADELIGSIKQMIERAHAHGIKVAGCTLTPYEAAGYFSDKGEEVRQAVNRWIRTGGAFDAVVDFEKATQDTSNPKTFKAGFNNGDHLHPNDAGYKAMADAIDLKIFSSKK
jgi:lysophospholipase L1-like esterase